MKRQMTQWQRLGETDPYWAVLSDPKKRGGAWEPQEFFETGEREISDVMQRVEALPVPLRRNRALDFGCGVGRLSRALAGRFREVTAVDISEPMLREARAANGASHPNISFVLNTQPDLRLFADDSFDFIYSNIVLQHIPRNAQQRYIKEFCRILKPQGMLVFQTPSRVRLDRWRGYVLLLFPQVALNFASRLMFGRDGVMEMHCVPRAAIEKLLRENAAANLLQVERHDSAGASFVSYRYYATKDSASEKRP